MLMTAFAALVKARDMPPGQARRVGDARLREACAWENAEPSTEESGNTCPATVAAAPVAIS